MSKRSSRNPTIREVAKLARVGLMTVSRVINDHPSVRPETRRKVESAIAQLGYQQNEAARLLKGQRAKLIGLVVPDLSDQFFASCAHTIQHIARMNGYMTLVVASERDEELELEQAELMAKRMISGLLLVSSVREENERLRKLIESDLPIVAFDRPLPGLDTDSVLVENLAGAEAAVRHLLGHGHRRILCMGYDEWIYTVRQRVEGYRHAMLDAGRKPELCFGLETLEHVREWVESTWGTKNWPPAIFAINHRTSTYLLQCLNEKGIRVPDDVALLGFDDFDLAGVVQPPITTVAQSTVELARRAMNLLLDRIRDGKGPQTNGPAKILLPAKLIVRKSCGGHHASATKLPHSSH